LVGGTSHFSLDSGRVIDGDAAVQSFGQIAVLYRLAAQRRALLEAFDRSGIPYQVVGDALSDFREVRGVLALLRLRVQPQHAALALPALLGRGRGSLAADALSALAAAVQARAVEAVLRDAATDSTLPPAARKRVGGLSALWADWPDATRLETLIPRLAAAWAAWQGETLTQAQSERIGQLRLRSVPFGEDAAAWLDHMALQSGADAYDPRADRVALMTLHASKGLEFAQVFVVGCEEGLLPYLLPGMSPGAAADDAAHVDVAEERRLFYVGMTRAQAGLTLTHAARRRLFGQTVTPRVSRFVEEIEAARKAVMTPAPRPPRREKAAEDAPPQLSLFE
jgi:superfamily I DNA/RNA helicase